MADKLIDWVGTSFEDLREFPNEARREAGYQLRRVQSGSMPTDWKPMPSVGQGAAEIRIHAQVEHRVIYVAKFEEAVYVLHVFAKKSRQTREADIDIARDRLREVLASRRKR